MPRAWRPSTRWSGRAGLPWTLRGILPSVLRAGRPAGRLSTEGARLLDPTGTLRAGVPLCPPEGDAGTGMVATNAVRPRSGNVSAGTSVFAMVVLDGPLARLHPETRHRRHARRPPRGHGALEQRVVGPRRLDGRLRGGRPHARASGEPGRTLRAPHAAGPRGGPRRGRPALDQLRLGRAPDRFLGGPAPVRPQARQRVHAPEPRPGDALRLALRNAQRPRHPDPGRGRRDRGDPRSRRLLPGRRHRAADHGRRARRPGQPSGRRRRGRRLGYGRPCRLHAPRRPGPVAARLPRRARRGHHRRRRSRPTPSTSEGSTRSTRATVAGWRSSGRPWRRSTDRGDPGRRPAVAAVAMAGARPPSSRAPRRGSPDAMLSSSTTGSSPNRARTTA